MKRFVLFGMITIVVMFICIAPAIAQSPGPLITITKSGPDTVCTGGEMTYDIDVSFTECTGTYLFQIADTYPATLLNLHDITSFGEGTTLPQCIQAQNPTQNRLFWTCKFNCPFTTTLRYSATAPSVEGDITNTAVLGYKVAGAAGGLISDGSSSKITEVTACHPAPEFPSAFLPAAMIIGLLGAVLLIQRTREH